MSPSPNGLTSVLSYDNQTPFFSRRNRVIRVHRDGVSASEGDFSEGSRRGWLTLVRRCPPLCPSGRGHGQLSPAGDCAARTHVCERPQHVPGWVSVPPPCVDMRKGAKPFRGDRRAGGALGGLPAAGLQGQAGPPGACGCSERSCRLGASTGDMPRPGRADPRPLGFTLFLRTTWRFSSLVGTLLLFFLPNNKRNK